MDEGSDRRPPELSLLVSLTQDPAGRRQLLIGALDVAAAAGDSTLFFDRYYARTPRDQRLVCDVPRSEAEMADLGRAVMAALQMHSAQAAISEPADESVDPAAGIFAA